MFKVLNWALVIPDVDMLESAGFLVGVLVGLVDKGNVSMGKMENASIFLVENLYFVGFDNQKKKTKKENSFI